MNWCTSCRNALPEGCSACRPIPTVTATVGPITYYLSMPDSITIGGTKLPLRPVTLSHTCPQCMRGLPCDPSSLSSLVGAVASQSHHRTDEEWKRGAFRSQADGSWDACGTPVDSAPTPEVQ